MADSPRDDIEIVLANGQQAAEEVREDQANKPTRRQTVKISTWAAVAAAALSAAISILVSTSVNHELSSVQAGQQAGQAATAESKRLATQAYDEAVKANEELRARGQEPVPLPPPDEDPAETIASAAAAKVLAQLPDFPTHADLGAAVGEYIRSNPQGPTENQLASLIAGYFVRNPPPEGRPGRAPTADEIMVEVATYCASRNECQGATGAKGATGDQGFQGVGVGGFKGFVPNPESATGCDLVITLVNPANGATADSAVPAPAEFCEE